MQLTGAKRIFSRIYSGQRLIDNLISFYLKKKPLINLQLAVTLDMGDRGIRSAADTGRWQVDLWLTLINPEDPEVG